ncbi:MAG: hypothetical protein Tsb0015_17350 [Simkaniaceae bacterium]
MKFAAIYPEGKFYTLAAFHSKGKQLKPLTFLSFQEKELKNENFKELFGDSSKKIILASALKAGDLWLKKIPLSTKNLRAAKKAAFFQLEAALPYPISESAFTYIINKKNVSLLSVSRSAMEQHIDSCKIFALDPEVISSAPTALQRYIAHFYPQKKNFLAIHMGREDTFFIFQKDGSINHITSFPIGYQSFIEGLKKDLSKLEEEKIYHLLEEMDFQGLENTAYQNLLFKCQLFFKNLDRALYFFRQKEKEFGEIFLTGHFCKIKTLVDKIQSQFDFPISGGPHEAFSYYAIPYGLCLDMKANDAKSVQLRQGKYLSKKLRKNIFQRFKFFYLCSLAISTFMMLFSSFLKNAEEKKLKKELMSFASDQEKNYTVKQLLEKLDLETKGKEKRFFLDKEPSKVSEIINFLVNHPNFSGREKEMELTRFAYQLVDYPSPQDLGKKYTIKVDLDFKASSQVDAHEFYDALKKDPNIDTQKGIAWNRKNDEYQISFYFKS